MRRSGARLLALAGGVAMGAAFWAKGTVWSKTERDHALATKGSRSFYSLGMFVLRPQS